MRRGNGQRSHFTREQVDHLLAHSHGNDQASALTLLLSLHSPLRGREDMTHRHALVCITVRGLIVLAGYAHPVQRHLCSNRALSTFHALMRFHASCAFGFIHSRQAGTESATGRSVQSCHRKGQRTTLRGPVKAKDSHQTHNQ